MQPLSPQSVELLRFAGMHRRHTEALTRATGERFNVFKILGIGRYEVRTHSPMLGDLLKPQGSHGQGDIFLQRFVTQMAIADFDTASASLELEYYIGEVTEKSGGRLDIVISDGNGNAIYIENKIDAEDQPNQLQRYRQRNAGAHLFYLTLQGSLPAGFPDEQSLKAINARCISYATDIRDWLADCQKEAASLPHVRETISQYLHLVQELTGQSTTQSMNEELIKRITADDDSLTAYFELTSQLENVKSSLVAKLDAQLDDAAMAANLRRDGRISELHAKNAGIFFTTDSLAKHNLQIGFAFDRRDYQDLDFGFVTIDAKKPCDVADKLLTLFRNEFPAFQPTPPNECWPAWADFEDPYGHWESEAFQAIASGKLAANMQDKLTKMSKIAKKVCP
jgi:hypothetical protein